MIKCLDALRFLLNIAYGSVFFLMIKMFLPMKKNRVWQVLAFLVCLPLTDTIIYSDDPAGLFGTMLAFFLYLLICWRGTVIEKVSVLLTFYPTLIAVNYLTQDIGARFFFGIEHVEHGVDITWNHRLLLVSTAIYTLSYVIRLLFWLGGFLFLRRFLKKTELHLPTRMWLLVDVLLFALFVAIVTVIYLMPEDTFIAYPVCGAAIFSSFGCMYLTSYIYNSMQVAYQAQELKMQYGYYEDKLKEEERIRSIYHDLKNHLLVLEAQNEQNQGMQVSIESLQNQISDYENYQHTGNKFLDIIIRDKARTAKEKQIDFCALIQFAEGDFIEPLDISTIFGNALDNAIEASEKLPKEKRLITVKTARVRDLIAITVENNAVFEKLRNGNTSKSDSFLHGFGISNIKKAVEKYEGQCNIYADEDTFTLKIIIPIPS